MKLNLSRGSQVALSLGMILVLASCGQSADEAYDLGFEEGMAEVCYEVEEADRQTYYNLRTQKIC